MSKKGKFDYGDSFFEEENYENDYHSHANDKRNSQRDKRRESQSERFLYIKEATQVSDKNNDEADLEPSL